MGGLRCFALLVLCCLANASSSVIELTASDLDARLAHGTWLLEFYAPWCGYCKRLEESYQQVAETLAGTDVNVARIDGSKFKSASLRFGIQGFPTILHVKEQVIRRYRFGDTSQSRTERFANTKDALVEYGLKGWESDTPELASPLGSSPLGSGALAVGAFVDAVLALQDRYDSVRLRYKLSHAFLLGACCLVAMLIGSVLGMLLSLLTPAPRPDKKKD